MTDPTAGTKDPERTDKPSMVDEGNQEGQRIDVSAVTAETLLASYVSRVSTSRYTDEANACLLLEAKAYIADMCNVAEVKRRADRNVEMVLEPHVSDAATDLRNKRDDPWKTVADWCKWIGFFILGLAIPEGFTIYHSKQLPKAGFVWFCIGIAFSLALIISGARIDKPLQVFRRRSRG